MARKGGLGKGLESLMGGADAEVSAITPSSTLPLSQIKPNKGQPRKKFDQQSLEDLSDSIKKNGVLQPILVRKKGANYEIVAGERRYQAAKLAGLEEIPVSIREISDDEVFQLALIENLQRSDLDPIEEALGYRKLIKDNGFTQEQLGKILSKSRSAIANSLRLLDLPQEVQDMMADGKLTAGHARAILAVAGEEGKLKLAQKVLEQGLSVRQTENLAPLFSGNNETGEKPRREPVPQSFKRAQRQLRLVLDTNVKVKRVRNKNKVEIEFADEEELAQLVDRLSGGMEAL
ncbi:ParB/RepB/Spo0J family partition protein [Olsenella phocaeensis]|uniref:ParB/RepB/Spo0J family partition protein n=1 Tax=Olsenella phocaeensis TaxID=1852385 RepID=UPI003A92DCBD